MADDPLSIYEPRPAELRVQNNGHLLKVTFEDGTAGSVSSKRLRDAIPDEARPNFARCEVAIVSIEQVTDSAIRIGFDDGHDIGEYSWWLLRSLTAH
jgi:DUF971 family protein